MPTEPPRPSTIAGIKKLAKQLHKATGSKYFESLNAAALQAGFENFNNAQNRLGGSKAYPPRESASLFSLKISTVWRDPVEKTTGTESMSILLPLPWREICPPKHLVGCYFDGLEVKEDNHLVLRAPAGHSTTAQRELFLIARAFRFAGATGLVPVRFSRRHYPRRIDKGTRTYELILIPREEHTSYWIEPKTGSTVIVDEPYGDPAAREAVRHHWCRTNGFKMALPEWPGIHNPGDSTRMALFSRNADLTSIAERLNALPALSAEGLIEPWYQSLSA